MMMRCAKFKFELENDRVVFNMFTCSHSHSNSNSNSFQIPTHPNSKFQPMHVHGNHTGARAQLRPYAMCHVPYAMPDSNL
ncbi:unnamed protein product [Ambrosiozyma monospora]|uniref:Unnamed protein product n=1 Tax=Ambrosiozyma monospora TaxID=43982 RepID=A0A9W6YNC2_AMBMO|nr:unnamed protein product [Ambrosiozyma monospora]